MKRYLATLLLLAISNNVEACTDPRQPSFLSSLETGTSIFVFRVTSLKMTDRDVGELDVISGPIQIVRTMKGKPSFRRVAYHDTWCSGIQLIVGHYYVASTRQDGGVLALVRGDNSILDVSSEYGKPASQMVLRGLTNEIAAYASGKGINERTRTYLNWANLHGAPPPPPL